MDRDPDLSHAVDEPDPTPVDDDVAFHYQSLWLSRARASAARSEPFQASASAQPDSLEDAESPGSSGPDASGPADAAALTYEPPADEAYRVDERTTDESPVLAEEPLADEPPATGEPWLENEGPLVEESPLAPEPLAVDELLHVGDASPADESPVIDEPALRATPGLPADPPEAEPPLVEPIVEACPVPAPRPSAALVPAAVLHPPAQGRVSGWSFGHMAGVALAAVGGAAIVLTMLVPRHGSTNAAGSAPAGSAAVTAAPVGTRPSAPARVASRWRQTSEWTGGGRKSLAYELAADRPVRLWMRQVTPLLVVRCLGGSLDAFVVTGSASAMEPGRTDHTVRLAFDDSPDLVERWGDSAEHDGLFAPDGHGVLARASSAERLRFTFTPHNAPAAEASFNLAGADVLVAPLLKNCRPASARRR